MTSLQFRKNERFYHVYLQENFFGGITVLCSWGTFDSKRGNCKNIFCNDMDEVHDALEIIKKTRARKGYVSYSDIDSVSAL